MKGDNASPRAQTVVFLGLGGIIAFVLAFVRGSLHLAIPVSLTLNFLLLILLATPAYLLSYRAYQLIGASEVALLLSTGRLWNVVGAAFFLHEALTLQHIVGAIIVLLGVAIVLYDKKKFSLNKGALFVLVAAFLFGMNDINGYYILKSFDATNFLIYSEFLPVIALFVLQPTLVKKLTYYFQKDKALKVSLLALGDAFGMLTLFLAYQAGGKASVIGPLSATRVLVTTVLAVVILKERNNITNKLIGAVVAVVGVILLL